MIENRKRMQAKQLQQLGISLVTLASVSTIFAYFFFDSQHSEAIYMMSAVFGLMGTFCLGSLLRS
jgi:hypothetical protein